MKYKIGDIVAVHHTKDKVIKYTACFGSSFFDYPENGYYKRERVINIKKHWNYFFKTMVMLSDGFWYDIEDITPIIRCYAQIGETK